MTNVGPPIRVGVGPSAGGPVVVDGPNAGAPVVVVGSGAQAIEDLTNVAAQDAPSDSVLVKDTDGVWRPRSVSNANQRGSVITFVDGDLTSAPAGARPGDYYVSLSTAKIYQVQES